MVEKEQQHHQGQHHQQELILSSGAATSQKQQQQHQMVMMQSNCNNNQMMTSANIITSKKTEETIAAATTVTAKSTQSQNSTTPSPTHRSGQPCQFAPSSASMLVDHHVHIDQTSSTDSYPAQSPPSLGLVCEPQQPTGSKSNNLQQFQHHTTNAGSNNQMQQQLPMQPQDKENAASLKSGAIGEGASDLKDDNLQISGALQEESKQATSAIQERNSQDGGEQEEDEEEDEDEEDDDEDEDEETQNDESDDDDNEDDEDDLIEKMAEESPKGRFKRFHEELGRGAYKVVFKGVDQETGKEVAWNQISLLKLPQSDRHRIRQEIDLIKKLEHPNIIHFISGWQNKEKSEVVFITEITSGTLRRYIKRNQITKLAVIKKWCQKILAGLVYLHEQPVPIIHRDLKCDNIFINSNSGEIRIGDLGLSTPLNNSYTSSVLGTPEFMAPELYEEHYDCKVDIYAFGMCMLEMITQALPYKECSSPAQIYRKVTDGVPPMALSMIQDETVSEFIENCLDPDKTKRPKARELLESAFIQTLDDEKSKEAVPLGKPQHAKRASMIRKRRKSFLAPGLKQSVIPEVEDETSDHEADHQHQHNKNSSSPGEASKKGNQLTSSQQQHQNQQSSQQPQDTQEVPVTPPHKQPQDDCNQTQAAGKIESQIREMNAEEQDKENNIEEMGKQQQHPLQIKMLQQQSTVAVQKSQSVHLSNQQQIQQQSMLRVNPVEQLMSGDRRDSVMSAQSVPIQQADPASGGLMHTIHKHSSQLYQQQQYGSNGVSQQIQQQQQFHSNSGHPMLIQPSQSMIIAGSPMLSSHAKLYGQQKCNSIVLSMQDTTSSGLDINQFRPDSIHHPQLKRTFTDRTESTTVVHEIQFQGNAASAAVNQNLNNMSMEHDVMSIGTASGIMTTPKVMREQDASALNHHHSTSAMKQIGSGSQSTPTTQNKNTGGAGAGSSSMHSTPTDSASNSCYQVDGDSPTILQHQLTQQYLQVTGAHSSGGSKDNNSLIGVKIDIGSQNHLSPPAAMQLLHQQQQNNGLNNVSINQFNLATTAPPSSYLQSQQSQLQQYNNSDGNQSQSSGMTMRKNTDVGNPDCTFSDPKFVQENFDTEQSSLVSSQSQLLDKQQILIPFAALAASANQNDPEQPTGLSRQQRAQSNEAQFGGYPSEEDDDADEEDYLNERIENNSDDDEESAQKKLNESTIFLNKFDIKKHKKIKKAQVVEKKNVDSCHQIDGKSGKNVRGIKESNGSHHRGGREGAPPNTNILDEFKTKLEQEDKEMDIQSFYPIVALQQQQSQQQQNTSNSGGAPTNIINQPGSVVQAPPVQSSSKQSKNKNQKLAQSKSIELDQQNVGGSLAVANGIKAAKNNNQIQSNGAQPSGNPRQQQSQQLTAQAQSQHVTPRRQRSTSPSGLAVVVNSANQAVVANSNSNMMAVDLNSAVQVQQQQTPNSSGSNSQALISAAMNTLQQHNQQLQQQQEQVNPTAAASKPKNQMPLPPKTFGEDQIDGGGASQLLIDNQTHHHHVPQPHKKVRSDMGSSNNLLAHTSKQSIHTHGDPAPVAASVTPSNTRNTVKKQSSKMSLNGAVPVAPSAATATASATINLQKRSSRQQVVAAAANSGGSSGLEENYPHHQVSNKGQQQVQSQQVQQPLMTQQHHSNSQQAEQQTPLHPQISSEYDEQRSSSDSEDSEDSYDQNTTTVAANNNIMPKKQHQLQPQQPQVVVPPQQRHLILQQQQQQQQQKVNKAGQQQVQQPQKKVSTKVSSSNNIMAAKSAANNNGGASSTNKAKQQSMLAVKQTGLKQSQQQQQLQLQTSKRVAHVPTGDGVNWTLVTDPRKQQQQQQQQPISQSNSQPNSAVLQVVEHQVAAAQSQSCDQQQQQQQQQLQTPGNVGGNGGNAASRLSSERRHLQTMKSSNSNHPRSSSTNNHNSRPDNTASGVNNNAEEKIVSSRWEKRSRNVIAITIWYPDKKTKKHAKFDFNIFEDTAQGVVDEMVNDLKVDPSFTQLIKNEIELSVKQFQNQEEAKKAAEKEKEKLIKHKFGKLQTHLDVFFAEMKQLGLHSSKDICRTFEQFYPAAAQQHDMENMTNGAGGGGVGQSSSKQRLCYIDGLSKLNKLIKQGNSMSSHGDGGNNGNGSQSLALQQQQQLQQTDRQQLQQQTSQQQQQSSQQQQTSTTAQQHQTISE